MWEIICRTISNGEECLRYCRCWNTMKNFRISLDGEFFNARVQALLTTVRRALSHSRHFVRYWTVQANFENENVEVLSKTRWKRILMSSIRSLMQCLWHAALLISSTCTLHREYINDWRSVDAVLSGIYSLPATTEFMSSRQWIWHKHMSLLIRVPIVVMT